MDPRRLLARLNPPTKQIPAGADLATYRGGSASMRRALETVNGYRPGELSRSGGFTRMAGCRSSRGGVDADAITPTDVAHALASIRNCLARELFCHLWWPAGAERVREELDATIEERMLREYSRRARACLEARTELAAVEIRTRSKGKGANRGAKRRAKRAVTIASERRFPDAVAEYGRIRDAVLHELADLRLCPDCKGRGERPSAGGIVPCIACQGNGTLPETDYARAERLGKSYTAFRTTWSGLYSWIFDQCQALEARAARRMRQALAAS
jgi:hypothetical protein